MKKFATNNTQTGSSQGTINSSTEVLANNLTYAQDAISKGLSDVIGDIFKSGIIDSGTDSENFPITINNSGSSTLASISIGMGVGYKYSEDTQRYERIAITYTTAQYYEYLPNQLTYDGKNSVSTPKSSGCANINVTGLIPNKPYWIDLQYLFVCDNGNTKTSTEESDGNLTNYSIAYDGITKRFYQWADGYKIVLLPGATIDEKPAIKGLCLGMVSIDNSYNVTVDTTLNRTQFFVAKPQLVLRNIEQGTGISVSYDDNDYIVLQVLTDGTTTEINDDNQVSVTLDARYPYTKFAINSGPETFLTNPESNILSLTIAEGAAPLWVTPANAERYAITSNMTITSINVPVEVQAKFDGTADMYLVCVNNTDISNNNAPLSTPKIEIMLSARGSTHSPGNWQYKVWFDVSEQPYKAKWYNGTDWVEYHGVPIGMIKVLEGGVLDSVYQYDFNRDYSQWHTIGEIMPYVGGTVPKKYLICNGSLYNPLQYNDLYSKIGYKFGGTEGGDFAVPNFLNRVIWGGASIDTFTPIAAGIPNIKGSVIGFDESMTCSGAFSLTASGSHWNVDGGSGADYRVLNFNAANGATTTGIYSDSVTTVQPPALQVPILIKYTI